MNFVGIHVTTIRHTEFHKYENPVPKEQLLDILCYIFFYQRHILFLYKPTDGLIQYIRIFLRRRNTLLYSSQVQYRGST